MGKYPKNKNIKLSKKLYIEKFKKKSKISKKENNQKYAKIWY